MRRPADDLLTRWDITLEELTRVVDQNPSLLRNELDILAVNVFAFENKWRFAFARNAELPGSRFRGYPAYQRAQLLATMVEVAWPPRPPFRPEPFTLMNEILQERRRSTPTLSGAFRNTRK